MPYKNKEDEEKAKKAWYEDHKQECISASIRHRDEKIAKVIALKNRPCMDCGKRYPHYVMDLDHVRGKKVARINRMVRSYGRKALEEELAKCEVVCSNCHRERTWERAQVSE